MFKINFLKLLFLVTSVNLTAQIGIGTNTPHASSVLDVESNSKGFLPPRMTESQRDNINGQDIAEGLVIYNTDENCINFYNGTDWISLCNLNSGGSTPAPIPDGMMINSDNKINYIASVFDVDYLPYTAPTGPADTTLHSPNTATTETTVDIQGILTTTGITVTLPYSITGTVDYVAYDYDVVVADDLTEDGNGRTVNFHYDAATSVSGSGNITMTIKAIGGDLNLKKLDINRGIGNGTATEGNINTGVLGVLIAEAPFYIDDQNTTKYIQIRDISGIPDRRFGEETDQGTEGLGFYHNNLYLPVELSNGQVWLNNNLGADYANINNVDFNLSQQATSATDYKAFGSLYQWGRYSDGHELIKWTSATSRTSINPAVQNNISSTNNPGHNQFIRIPSTPGSWMTNVDNTLWQTSSGVNNPCPHGFRIPTESDITTFKQVEPFNNLTEAFNNTSLKITTTGNREAASGSFFGGYNSFLLQDIISTGTSGRVLFTNSAFSNFSSPSRADGGTVRCIQHVIEPATIPAGMTINSDNKINYIASIDDVDYLPYSTPTGPADITTENPGLPSGETPVDLQGTLTTSGITIKLPYTISGSVNYEEYDYNVDVPASLTEDGNGRTVNFHYDAATSVSGSGNITMTIRAIGGDLNLKKLDLNRGIGDGSATEGNINNGVFGVLIAEAPFYLDNQKTTKYIQIRDIPGIPDRMFGQASADGDINEHDFLYLPVEAEDGKIWLNNNLGSNYSNLNIPAIFNINSVATGVGDIHASGSLFLWGRGPDGHELINRNTQTHVNAKIQGRLHPTTSNSSSYNYNLTQRLGSLDGIGQLTWMSTANTFNLWQPGTQINNPCPHGFRVPSVDDFDNLIASPGFITSSAVNAINTNILKFPYTGQTRSDDAGAIEAPSFRGEYYTSSRFGSTRFLQGFRVQNGGVGNSVITYPGIEQQASLAIRCIQE